MTLPALQQSAEPIRLPAFRDILIRRRIEAPRRLVWEVLTRPEHLARWLGAPRDAIVRCDVEVCSGGRFDFAWRRGGGGITILRGTYHDVVAGHRLVLTMTERCTNTLHAITLDDIAQSTRLVLRSLSPSSATNGDSERLTRLERYLRALA